MRIGQGIRVVVVLVCVAFAAASATAPKTHTVNKSSAVSHGREETWSALVDIFADRNWEIDNLDKDSGIITTDWMALSREDVRYADCGSDGMAVINSTEIRFNVRVKGDDVASTVTVNTKFRQERFFDNKTWSVDCTSRGIVEGEIQNAVDSMAVRVAKKAKPKKPPKVEPAVAPVARGFFCSSNAASGFCVRQKAECIRTRDVSLTALPDLTDCALTERAWCSGDRCAPTAEICETVRARGAGPDGSAAACVESE